jgi:polyisoprenoid-binding protein YceI
MKRLIAVALAAVLPALALADTTNWTIDPAHTDSTFAVRHLVISTVRGHFGKTTGTLKLDEKDISKSSVEATIDTTTIDTRVEKRDTHLKSADFLEVEKYPTITFKSTKVQKAGADKLKVTGNLTMKATTKPVVLEVVYGKPITDPGGNTRRGFSAKTSVNRKEYGLQYSKAVEAGPVVGDKVDIVIDAEVIKDKPKEPAAAAMQKESAKEAPAAKEPAKEGATAK